VRRSSLALVTVFGLGHAPVASGTFGSLPPIAIAAGLWLAGFHPGAGAFGSGVYHGTLACVLLIFSLACVLQGTAAEARFGHDPSEVVADETAGQCIPLMFLPASVFADWRAFALALLGAFLAFRLLDIVKPWPARGLQRVPGGWGILLDDLAAGVYALLLAQVTTRLLLS
jgi:phosphatidylglycerophosphatase A